MRRVLACVAIFLVALSFAGKIEFYGGGEKKAKKIILKNGEFVVDGEKIPKAKIRRVVFAEAKKGKVEAKKVEEAYPPEFLMAVADSLESKYPDAAGLILIDHGYSLLRSDGTRYYKYHFAGKILKSSRLEWGKRRLYINEGRSASRVLWARVILPDSTIVYADTSKATISSITRGGPFFGYGKVYSLDIPNVQVGAIVEYVYETETYNPYDTFIYRITWYFQDEDPVYSSRYEVRIPKDKTLYYFFQNPGRIIGSALYYGTDAHKKFCLFPTMFQMDGFKPGEVILADSSLGEKVKEFVDSMRSSSPEVTVDDTSKLYRWHYMHVPPFVYERRMIGYSNVTPNLYGVTMPDWDYLFDWLANFQKKRMIVTDTIQKLVDEIIKGAKTPEEKIDRIYRWVQRKIRYISIKGSVSSGQTGHPAEETLENGYGDCSDKGILLCTMLKAAGFEAHPIILYVGSEDLYRCLPSTRANHLISRVKLPDGHWQVLDATSLTYKYPYFSCGDHGASFVDAISKEVGIIPLNAPEENLERLEVKLKLSADGSAKADFKSIPIGMLEAGYRAFWEYQQKERYRVIVTNWMNSVFPRAKIDTFGIEGLGSMDSQLCEWAKVSVDSFPSVEGDIWIVDIPGVKYSMSGFEEVNLAERKYAIKYSCPRAEEYNVTIELPKGARVLGLPEGVKLSCEPYADFSITYSKKGNKITVHEKFRLKKIKIPTRDYQRYKDFIIAAKQAAEQRIFIKKPR